MKPVFLPLKPITNREGISIQWTRTSSWISISGWYDGSVSIDGDAMKLRDFFDLLGITEADCCKAWKDKDHK